MKKFILVGIISLLFFACGNEKKEMKVDLPEGTTQIEVVEHMNGGGYTFIKGKTDNGEQWIAIREMPVETGEVYYFTNAMEMKEFESKSLNKTFASILFVNDISKNFGSSEQPMAAHEMPPAADGHTKPQVEANSEISVEPLEDGQTIAQIAEGKTNLSGKTVKVKGIVTKFNGGIMNRNWLHIQDGTKSGETIDITVTSDQSAKLGETIVVEGTLATDKDFGAGYFYEMIIENATITSQKTI